MSIVNVLEIGCYTTSPSTVFIHTSEGGFSHEYYIYYPLNNTAWNKGMELKQYSDEQIQSYLDEFNSDIYELNIYALPSRDLILMSYKRKNPLSHHYMMVHRFFNGFTSHNIDEAVMYLKSFGNDILNHEDEIRMLTIL